MPGKEPVDPLPEAAEELWAVHDPGPLGFERLGELASAHPGSDALTRLWVDEGTRTTVATVTVRPGGEGGTTGWRGAFTTFYGDPAEPGTVQVTVRSSAMFHHVVRPGSQTLYWPAAGQGELLRIHRRQQRTVRRDEIPVVSLDDVHQLMSRAQDAQRNWLISSGVLREEDDGRLSLRPRALMASLVRRLPTAKAAARRADRRARRTVDGWPAPDPDAGP